MRSRWQRQQQQALARDSSAQVEFCDENPVMPTQRAPKDEAGAAHRSSSRKCKGSSRFALAVCCACGLVRTCRRQRVRAARAQRAESAP